ncbi:MAG: tetratricopeptide repeat protein [Syntrophales bacterium]|jgi:tetratricopeptide (TPR) repeat protein|nr:tetratricopeptide repeat protein [Syntrophales bacterium]
MSDENLRRRETFLADAEDLFRNRLYAEAAEAAESRLRDHSADLDAKAVLCRALIGMERLQEAVRCLGEIEEAILGLSRVYASLGDLCRRKGLRDEAVAYYRKCVAIHPHSSVTEEVNGRLDELLKETSPAKTVGGEDAEAPLAADFQTVTMADLYVRQGHLDEALDLLEKILHKDPEDPQAARLIAKVREKMATSRMEATGKEKHSRLIDELQRWLNNIERMRSHGT